MDMRNERAKRRIGATASVKRAVSLLPLMLAVIAVIAVIGCAGEASGQNGLPVEGPTAKDVPNGASSGESSEDSDDNGPGDNGNGDADKDDNDAGHQA